MHMSDVATLRDVEEASIFVPSDEHRRRRRPPPPPRALSLPPSLSLSFTFVFAVKTSFFLFLSSFLGSYLFSGLFCSQLRTLHLPVCMQLPLRACVRAYVSAEPSVMCRCRSSCG